MKRFEGKVVVITGGGRGIGKACAERFAAEGAAVSVLDVNSEIVTAAAEFIGGLGLVCDVTDHQQVHQAIQQTVRHFGRLDVLVANAGIYRSAPLTKDALEDWQQVLQVNLTGTFLSCHAAAPYLIQQGGGSIVVMSSMAARTSWPNTAAYSASKSGAIGLVHAVAAELGPHNINCNAVCLGHADTDMMREVDWRICAEKGWPPGSYLQQLAASNPMRRLARLEEVAALVAFLASEEARYINGQAIELDGGLIMS